MTSHLFLPLVFLVPMSLQDGRPEASFSTAEALGLRERKEVGRDEDQHQPQHLPQTAGPGRSIEFALSRDSYWFGLRTPVRFGSGNMELGVLGDDDDDFALVGRLVRYGRPFTDQAWSLGAGVAVYAASFDVPVDADAYALALVGSARFEPFYALPLTFEVDLSFAPDVTTWSDGEELVDARFRAEFELSPFASAFVGYRHLEVDLGSDGDGEVDERVHAGVRLAF